MIHMIQYTHTPVEKQALICDGYEGIYADNIIIVNECELDVFDEDNSESNSIVYYDHENESLIDDDLLFVEGDNADDLADLPHGLAGLFIEPITHA